MVFNTLISAIIGNVQTTSKLVNEAASCSQLAKRFFTTRTVIFIMLHGKYPRYGGVAEWFKAPVLKTGEEQSSVGSNPTSSTKVKLPVWLM